MYLSSFAGAKLNQDICDFIDEFDCDPVTVDDEIKDKIKKQGLVIVDNKRRSLIEALWSILKPCSATRPRWGLAQATVEDFEEKILNTLAQAVSHDLLISPFYVICIFGKGIYLFFDENGEMHCIHSVYFMKY